MALFGLFGKKSDASPLKKHAERVANKRAQAPDRWDSIQALAQDGSEEAVEALLARFTYYVDPSITDQEEKDAAFEAVTACKELAVGPVVRFLGKAESIAWPLKILDRIESQEVVVSSLLDLLSGMGVEYERDPQRKIDIIVALEERSDGRVVAAVERFVGDANETVRFAAVGTVLAQAEAADVRESLVRCACDEESVRVRNRIFEGFVAGDWAVPEGYRSDLTRKLTAGYKLDKRGHLRK